MNINGCLTVTPIQWYSISLANWVNSCSKSWEQNSLSMNTNRWLDGENLQGWELAYICTKTSRVSQLKCMPSRRGFSAPAPLFCTLKPRTKCHKELFKYLLMKKSFIFNVQVHCFRKKCIKICYRKRVAITFISQTFHLRVTEPTALNLLHTFT